MNIPECLKTMETLAAKAEIYTNSLNETLDKIDSINKEINEATNIDKNGLDRLIKSNELLMRVEKKLNILGKRLW